METTSIARKKGAEINETFQGKWPLLNVFVQLRRGILATRVGVEVGAFFWRGVLLKSEAVQPTERIILLPYRPAGFDGFACPPVKR